MNLFKTTLQHARRPGRLAVAGIALCAASASALAVEVTGAFSGWYDQPDQQNHGMIISIGGAQTGNKIGAVYWAIYDDAGNPSWLLATGDIVGDTIEATVYEVDGVPFGTPAGTVPDPVTEVGTMQVQFDDCDSANVDYQTINVIVGTGGFRIQRITNQPGAPCSGGIGDDIPPGTLPEEFDIALISTGVIPGASGDADFELDSNEVEFDVEIEDVPVGTYTLQVGGVERGTIQVVDTLNGTEGEIEFGSPPDADELLLDFDPRGQTIDVLDGSTVILSNDAPANGTVPGTGSGGTPPPFGNSEIEIDLVNLGVYPAGEADAEFEQRPNRVDFDVEVEDIPVGAYTLFVGGVERGMIQVVDLGGGQTEGELEFRHPVEAGKLPLDFDPRGQLIEVTEGPTALFSSDFPDDGDDGGDDGDDGGSPDGEIREDLNNLGVYPAGDGEARWRSDDGEVDFRVQIEDVPLGAYSLRVGGINRGTIEVINTSEGVEGELDFTTGSPDPDEIPLDFDPRGQLIEVLEGSTVIFTLDFPSS